MPRFALGWPSRRCGMSWCRGGEPESWGPTAGSTAGRWPTGCSPTRRSGSALRGCCTPWSSGRGPRPRPRRRRRGRRRVGALRAKLVELGKGNGGNRRKQNKRGGSGHGLNLHQGKHRRLLLFGLLSFTDQLADAAGVLAIEGLGERLAQGGLLRKGDEHAGPRDGLEQHPVQPHGEGHGQNHGKFGGALEQDGGFDDRAGSGIQAPRKSISTVEQL